MQAKKEAQVSGGMRALLDNLDELAHRWDQTPSGILAMAGLSTALYWQWKAGQSALIGKVDKLGERIGMTTAELVTPGFVAELAARGQLIDPFASARAALEEGIRKQPARLVSSRSSISSRNPQKTSKASEKPSKGRTGGAGTPARATPVIPALFPAQAAA